MAAYGLIKHIVESEEDVFSLFTSTITGKKVLVETFQSIEKAMAALTECEYPADYWIEESTVTVFKEEYESPPGLYD